MTKEDFFLLVDKYINGEVDRHETRIIDDFCQRSLIQNIEDRWSVTEEEATRLRILESITQTIREKDRQKDSRVRRWRAWNIAAVILLVIGSVYIFMFRTTSIENSEQPPIATITKVSKIGQRLTFTLGDGTYVKLNAGSSLSFPQTFNGQSREVILSGEGYFNVTENPDQPFIIRSEGLQTTVLGTSFNISASQDNDMVAVTVESGSVEVTDISNTEMTQVLTSGNQAIFNKRDSNLEVKNVSVEKFLSWKDGIIFLDGTTIYEATKILSKWYDVTFEFENEDIGHCAISGKFNATALESILENIRFMVGIDYEIIDGKKVLISGNSCN